MSVVSMRKLLEAGVHFGHQTRRWNPKMKPYIYTSRNNVYIINLEKTLEKLDIAYAAMKDIAEKGGKVLFVGTKKQAQTVVVEEALRSGSFFVNQRWLGGLMTNFRTIQKRVSVWLRSKRWKPAESWICIRRRKSHRSRRKRLAWKTSWAESRR